MSERASERAGGRKWKRKELIKGFQRAREFRNEKFNYLDSFFERECWQRRRRRPMPRRRWPPLVAGPCQCHSIFSFSLTLAAPPPPSVLLLLSMARLASRSPLANYFRPSVTRRRAECEQRDKNQLVAELTRGRRVFGGGRRTKREVVKFNFLLVSFGDHAFEHVCPVLAAAAAAAAIALARLLARPPAPRPVNGRPAELPSPIIDISRKQTSAPLRNRYTVMRFRRRRRR
jgi:hypothetical protein